MFLYLWLVNKYHDRVVEERSDVVRMWESEEK